jgi:serine/threonine-protein kinase/endoribonuclease IRE1
MTLPKVFLLLISISLIFIAEAISFKSQQGRSQVSAGLHLHEQLSGDSRFLPPLLGSSESVSGEDLHLLDVVLVASVDGKFHALNRTSGQTLWSMPSSADAPNSSGFAPLVRTVHAEADPDTTDDDTHPEIYVIEPQSGEIFVIPTPNSPLQRFPFTMPQLVEMTPFSLSGDDGSSIFIGRKETSLLLVDLETGKVKATVNSECPWDPFDDLAGKDGEETEIQDPEKETKYPSEVFIGRTGGSTLSIL